jgi:hypothetical protein
MAVESISTTTQASRDAVASGSRSAGSQATEEDGPFDGLTFWDALDVINPLQHVPVVGDIYRELTGDEIKSGPRLAGGLLFGGIVGLAGAAANVMMKELTGKDMGEHVVAMVDMAVNGEEAVQTVGIDTPSGQAASAQGLNHDPNAPLDLLPAKWRMAASGGMGVAGLSGAGAAGAAPVMTPLGYDALMPLDPPGSTPAVSPTGPNRSPVDLILPSQKAQATGTGGQTQSTGKAPVNLPLGYDVLAAQGTGAASGTPQTAALAAEGRQAHSLSETREFGGRTLEDYRNRPIRFNAGRSTAPTASTAANAASTPLTTPTTGPVPLTNQGRPDAAAMAQLLEAQANIRSLAGQTALETAAETDVGDVLTVPEGAAAATGAATQPTPSATPTPARTATTEPDGDAGNGDAAAANAIQPDAWIMNKMMMGLDKYQKARGAVPLGGGTDINA